MKRQAGLTLVELLVVLAIVALATAGTLWSMRQNPQRQLQQEAQRLSALLEAARAQAVLQGQVSTWSLDEQGRFVWRGPVPDDMPTRWEMDPAPRVQWPQGARELVLGPEPMIPASRITLELWRDGQTVATVVVGTDGLSPISPLDNAEGSAK